MDEARKTKLPSLPEGRDQAELEAEAKRVGLPSFLLKLAGDRDLWRLTEDGKPVSRPD
ncbi:MAG: hypothetical protein ACPGVU_23995 [Limisphaerales bacterium]